MLARHKGTVEGLTKASFTVIYHNNNCYNTIVVVQEDVLSALAKHLDKSALQTRSFLVDVTGTSIDEEHISKQVQMFSRPYFHYLFSVFLWDNSRSRPFI